MAAENQCWNVTSFLLFASPDKSSLLLAELLCGMLTRSFKVIPRELISFDHFLTLQKSGVISGMMPTTIMDDQFFLFLLLSLKL